MKWINIPSEEGEETMGNIVTIYDYILKFLVEIRRINMEDLSNITKMKPDQLIPIIETFERNGVVELKYFINKPLEIYALP